MNTRVLQEVPGLVVPTVISRLRKRPTIFRTKVRTGIDGITKWTSVTRFVQLSAA